MIFLPILLFLAAHVAAIEQIIIRDNRQDRQTGWISVSLTVNPKALVMRRVLIRLLLTIVLNLNLDPGGLDHHATAHFSRLLVRSDVRHNVIRNRTDSCRTDAAR